MRLGTLIVSGAIHGMVVFAMTYLPAQAKTDNNLVEMSMLEPPPPPPPPEPEPKPEPKKPPPPEVEPEIVKKIEVKKEDAPLPEPEKPPPPPPPPKGFSVDMASTVKGGAGPSVPAVEGGGNMFADPNDRNLEPAKKTPVRPPQPVGRGGKGQKRYQITAKPKFISSPEERTPPYPRAAKSLEIEGTVLLRIYIAEDGRVKQVKILKRLHAACDTIAVRWAKEKWRFKPAMAGPNAVGMWITVPVRFVLER